MTATTLRPLFLLALAPLALAGACAEGAPVQGDVDAQLGGAADASDPGEQVPDAAETSSADAQKNPADAEPGAPDARIADAAPPPPDAGCSTQQLLLNGNLDTAAPGGDQGDKWTQRRDIDEGAPVISSASTSPAAHTAPARIWLGGFNYAIEGVFQDVAVPAGTTALVLTGQRETRCTDSADHAEIEVRSTTDTVHQELARFSRTAATTAWTAFSYPVTGNHAGQTIRIYFKGTTDFLVPCSFLFDTLELNATVCP